MSVEQLFVRDVTILRAGASTDRYDNAVKEWAAATETETRGWLAQQNRSEVGDNREAQVSTWVLYLPAGEDIAGGDRVVVDDVTYEVVGPPNTAWSPRGAHHLEATLRHVTG